MSDKREDAPLQSQREDDPGAQPVSNRTLAIFFVALAIALVLGYLLLSKLVDISQEEDCALAHRRDCGASLMPLDRSHEAVGRLSHDGRGGSSMRFSLSELRSSRRAANRPHEAWRPSGGPARSLPA